MMDRNDQERFLGMMNTRYSAPAPQGVGPVAPGPTGVLSPEAIARMLAYEEELKRQKEVPQIQHTPIDQIVAAMAGGNAAQPAFIGPQADIIGSGAIPRSDQPDFSNPARTLPSKPKVKQQTEEAPKPQEQQTAPAQEQPASEPTPEATQAAAQEIQKAVQDVVKTPEDERLLNNAINRPTEDGTQSIAQRIAMIAMAVAPAAVGMALGGKKGAYIGGKATGDGLTAGTETYMKEEAADRADRKLDIEARKAEKKEKDAAQRNAFEKQFADQNGNLWFYDADRNTMPVMVTGQDGKPVQARKPNVPVYSMDPRSGRTESRMSFEPLPGQKPASQDMTPVSERIQSILDDANGLGIPVKLPRNIKNFADQNKTITLDQIEDVNLRNTIGEWERINDAAIRKEIASRADQKRKKELVGTRQSGAKNKEDVKNYERQLNNFRDKVYRPMDEKISKVELWASGGFNTQVENAAEFFGYMKEAQQDPSVIREGDQRTIESYMSIGTKIGQIEAVIANKGKMSDELRTDIRRFLDGVKRHNQHMLAKKTNEYAIQAGKTGMGDEFQKKVNPEIKSDAIGYAREKLTGKKRINLKQVADGVMNRSIQNGDMYFNEAGVPFIHEGIKYEQVMENGKSTVKIKNVGYPVRWGVK